jgi:hypothetical protein
MTAASTNPLAQMCGQDSRDIAGLPTDQFQQAIHQPTDAQRAALADLANASLESFWFRLKHNQRCADSWRILVV